jgi:hypothetical protein
MTRAEVVEQAEYLASESKLLADAFRPRASEGEVIRVPVAMAARLAEILGQMGDVMAQMAREAKDLPL